MKTVSLKDQLATWGYSAGWGLVRLAPERLARRAFQEGADLAFRRGAGAQLRKNLARVLAVPADQVPDDLIQRSLRSYARYWREAFRLPAMDHASLARDVHAAVTQQQHLDDAVVEGRGVVIALPHMGNWDLAGVWLVGSHGQFTTVAERLKPESLYQKFLAYRESLGFEILPHLSSADEAAGEGPYKVLAERLREGKVVCLLADRGMGRSSIPVRFFGETARFPVGPAKLAAETGAALVTAHTWYEPGSPETPSSEGRRPEGRWRAEVGPRIDVGDGVEAATARIAAAFETAIADRPEDWHMLQPLWDVDRAGPR